MYKVKNIEVKITDVDQLLVDRTIVFCGETVEFHSCSYICREAVIGMICGSYKYISRHGFKDEMFGYPRENIELDFIDGSREFFVGLDMSSGVMNSIGFSTMKEAVECFKMIRAWKYDHVEEE